MESNDPFEIVKKHIFDTFQVSEQGADYYASDYLELVRSKLGDVRVEDINQKWLRILDGHLTLHSPLKWRDKALQEISMRAMAEDTAKHLAAENSFRNPK